MPTKKITKGKSSSFDIQKLLESSDSYKSLIYGVTTVVVLFIVIALGVRTLSQNRAEIDDRAAMIDETSENITNSYVVSEGETLWSIAEKNYKNGYAWEEIAKANKLKEPYALQKGQKLTIPKLSPAIVKSSELSPMPTMFVKQALTESPSGPKIMGSVYKIIDGDNLWTIAERAYGDGYKWVEIAKENKLLNPDLIYPGDTLRLPRP